MILTTVYPLTQAILSITGADPGFLKGGGVQIIIRSTSKKRGGQTGVQFWVQC